MSMQWPGRVFLVTFAAVVTWRLEHRPVPLAAIAVVAVGWSLEAALVRRFKLAAGPRHEELLAAQPRRDELASFEAARSLPWVMASLAVMAWGAVRMWPELVRPQTALCLMALSHGTAFAVVRDLTWTEAALATSRMWRGFVSPAALGKLVAAATVVLPKRGSLTIGRPQVDQVESFRDDLPADEVLRLAAALLRDESSPLSRALQQAARQGRLALPSVADAVVLPGLGWSGTLDGAVCAVGGRALAEHLGVALPELGDELVQRQVQGGTMLLVFRGEQALGLVAIHDPLRPEAPRLMADLRRGGVRRLVVLSDDDPEAAEQIAARFEIDQVVPLVADEQAAAALASWREQGPVAVCAPAGSAALAAADLPIPLHRPDDPPPEDAELAMVGEDPARLPAAWLAAAAARRRDRKATRSLLLLLLAPIIAAAAGVPLPVVVALDELLICGVLDGFVRRAEMPLPRLS